MIDFLHEIELQVLYFINSQFTAPWADWFFCNVTDLHKNPIFGVLVILAVSFFSWRKYGREAWRVIVALALTVAIGDMLGYRLIKSHYEKPRPFQTEAIKQNIIQRADAHGNSFPSNHAINCFGSATILSIAFPAGCYFFYIIAALVGYSRLYLGVHFPIDVIGGALIGFVVARCVAAFLLNKFKTSTGPKS